MPVAAMVLSEKMSFPVIAIDGPAGAGKSTVARALARRLGFFLLDTGAIYRGLALFAQGQRVGWDDGAALAELAARLPLRFAEEGRVFLDGQDVTLAIRTPEISQAASQVSVHAGVRAALLGVQRQLATTGPCVAEGRDIGTVVLPDAPLKLFMTASPEVRARRRFEELRAAVPATSPAAIPTTPRAAPATTLEDTMAALLERDRRDETRTAAPTRQADDAVLFDTSQLSLDEVLDQIEDLCRSRLGLGQVASGPPGPKSAA
jgi:cytidylate kinase